MSASRDPLEAIAEARDAVSTAERNLLFAVAEARLAGCSWDAIGSTFGVSRQAAHDRWGAAVSVVLGTPTAGRRLHRSARP